MTKILMHWKRCTKSCGTEDYPDWRRVFLQSNPLSEQEECASCDSKSGGIYCDFCHIMRCWKNTVGFEFGGLLIDTLVYNHFGEKDNYKDSGYDDYLTILQNLFDYLQGRDKDHCSRLILAKARSQATMPACLPGSRPRST